MRAAALPGGLGLIVEHYPVSQAVGRADAAASATDPVVRHRFGGGVPPRTDARHDAAAGIPVVLYGAGPHTIEGANAHCAAGRLPLSDLHKATEVVAPTPAEPSKDEAG